MNPGQAPKVRLAFLDWARGLATAVMLQGHVFHSFTRNEERDSGVYVLSQFVGGVAPALFLFLTGVTYAFLMHSRERQGLSLQARWKAALRRAGYLLMLAVLFRLQLWIFAWHQSPWQDLFKVDVLNCMALTLFVLSPLALFDALKRARYAAIAGFAIAMLAPVITQMDWSYLHPFIRAYFVPNNNFFSFFPWASFIAFGAAYGAALKLSGEHLERSVQWGAIAGAGVFLAAYYLSGLPYSIYPKAEFWLDSPGLTIVKLGVILLVVGGSYMWSLAQSTGAYSWVRVLGSNSLLVYWVHIELVYGRWFGDWKQNLTVPQAAATACCLILLMLALCTLRRKLPQGWPMKTTGPVSRTPQAQGAGD